MDRKRFARAKALYLAVADLDPHARSGYLLEHASDDAELRREVEAWLAFDGDDAALAQLSISGTPPEHPPTLTAGDRLDDRYRIDAFIDRGGMGEVYRAMDEELGAPVAVKLIRRDIATVPAALHRLKQEVLSARSVTHPNVCRIFDFGRDARRELTFLTMELLPGETLEARLRTDGPLPPEEVMSILRPLADALDSAHAAGIVHRDIKCANIMLVPSASGVRPVVTDFGLAMPRSAHETADPPSSPVPIAGTPAYMSPEQARGRTVGPASDLYSLGVVLHEALTGHRPTGDGAHPRDLDPRWQRVVRRLLAPEPEDRFSTARAAYQALDDRPDADTRTPRHVLPAEHDAFVGRGDELDRLAHALEGDGARSAVVTVIGPAGVGKTRLAAHYARTHLARWPGGAWWVDLAEAREGPDVLASVARTLGVTVGGADPVSRLGHVMAGRGRCLVILDNVEQVVEAVHPVIDTWLACAPRASFVITSQERLRIPAETTLDVEPLDPITEGVELFVARARAARPLFRTDDPTRSLVREIVETLEGLPLAIELAASRLRMLSVEQLHDRLQDRFRVLVGGRRGRHETLRTALDWSWELLTPGERSAVAQASVFEGGFRLDAAECVIDRTASSEDVPVIDVLQSLVDKSWLRTHVAFGAPRFDMYATMHAYARHALDSGRDVSVTRDQVEERHARHVASLDTAETMRELNRRGGVERLGLERGNLVAACRRSPALGDPALVARVFAVTMALLRRTGPADFAIGLARTVLDTPGLLGRDLARVTRYNGLALSVAGRWSDARRQFEVALEIFRAAGDRHDEAKVLTDLGDVASNLGDNADALRCHELALEAYRAVGDLDGEGHSWGGLGMVHWRMGRGDDARRSFESALVALEESGNQRIEGFSHFGLGAVLYNEGRHDEARRHYERALDLFREVGDRGQEGSMLSSLGGLYVQCGAMERARRVLEEALVVDRDVGRRSGEAHSLTALGFLHANQGHFDEAERCLDAALTLNRRLENRVGEGLVLSYQGLVEEGRGHLDVAESRYRAALAIHREVGPRSQEAYVLTALGGICRLRGRLADARELLEAALTVCRDTTWRMGEGPIRVGLGAVDRLENRIEEASANVIAGVELMRSTDGASHGLARALCELGELHRIRHDREAARAALQEAVAVAKHLGVAADSAVSREVAALRDALDGDDRQD